MKTKKLFAIVLSALLCLSMIPVAALADDPVNATPVTDMPVTSLPTSCNYSAAYLFKNPEYKISDGYTTTVDDDGQRFENTTYAYADDAAEYFRSATGILVKFDNTQTVATPGFGFSIDVDFNSADGTKTQKFVTSVGRYAAHMGFKNYLIEEYQTTTWYLTTDDGASWTPVTQTYDPNVGFGDLTAHPVVTAEKVVGYVYIPFDQMLAKQDLNEDGKVDTWADLTTNLGEDFVMKKMYFGCTWVDTPAHEADFSLSDVMFVTVEGEHAWDAGVDTTPATHTEFGLKTYTCSTCGAQKSETTEKLPDHEYFLWTPNDDDTHIAVCACGASDTENHVWGEGVVTTAPTVDAEGVRTYTCVCGETKTESIPQLTEDPNAGGSNAGGDTTTTTAAPVAEEEKGGCGSVISTGAGMLMALAGAAALLGKKKRK